MFLLLLLLLLLLRLLLRLRLSSPLVVVVIPLRWSSMHEGHSRQNGSIGRELP